MVKAKNFLSSVLVILSFLTGLFFISCSESGAEIVNTTPTVVFEYKDENSDPDVKLSVFIQTEHEALRASTIVITSPDKNKSWTIKNPELFKASNKEYAGYTELKPAEGETIESGVYGVTYTDASGETVDSTFVVSFRKELLKSKLKDFKKTAIISMAENVAVYDKDMNMLYYGPRKGSWKNNSAITSDFARGVYIKQIDTSSASSIIVLHPAEKLKE